MKWCRSCSHDTALVDLKLELWSALDRSIELDNPHNELTRFNCMCNLTAVLRRIKLSENKVIKPKFTSESSGLE